MTAVFLRNDVIETPKWRVTHSARNKAEIQQQFSRKKLYRVRCRVTIIQGHRNGCKSKALIWLPISLYVPIFYRFRDNDLFISRNSAFYAIFIRFIAREAFPNCSLATVALSLAVSTQYTNLTDRHRTTAYVYAYVCITSRGKDRLHTAYPNE